MATWNTAFEAVPAGGASPTGGDDAIRDLKGAVRERVIKEHVMDLSGGVAADDGWHREGSAIAYYESSAPTNRPDAATSLDSDDAGRLWYDTDTGLVSIWSGSAWVPITKVFMRTSIDGTLAAGTDLLPHIVVPRAGTITKVTIHAETGPTGQALIVDINKNGSTTVFDTRVQIDAGSSEGSSTDIDSSDGVLAAEDYLTFDIDQVGSSVAGSGLSVMIEYALA